jgi:hypothetical protein
MWALVSLLFFPYDFETAIPIKETKVISVSMFESKEACHKRLYWIVSNHAGDTLAVNSEGDLEVTAKNLLSKHVCKKAEADKS